MRRTWYLGFGVVLLCVALYLAMLNDLRWFLVILIPLVCVGIYDVMQTRHAILRNFPVLGHMRFILEFFRPEIQQYFVADDLSERPFHRQARTIIYQRAKNQRDTVPFGTELNVKDEGYEWLMHSITPKHVSEVEPRITVGGPLCTKPYSASRLNVSAMSFGSLSPNAITALNKAAKIGNFAHNTGEGGISDYHLAGEGDLIWQIGTGYFGCRTSDGHFDPLEFQKEATRDNVKMIEIKLSQGAKPAHGGILPAAKLTPEICRIRKVPMGQDVLSPPGHSTFSTPEGLVKFIAQLRELSGGKPVGFKLCIGRKSQFLGICKAMLKHGVYPDFITVDGGEGGTGAAPLEFANHMGSPLNEGLMFVHNALVGIGLRDNIRIIAAGKVATGFDMVTKLAMGADMCNAARAMMMSIGCIQSMQCHANTCPTGVATQDPRLARGLVVEEKKIRAAQFHHGTVHSFLELIGAMGLTNPSEIEPRLVMRRTSHNEARSYADIYEFIKPGCLLDDNTVPDRFKKHWNLASTDSFH